MNRTIIRTLTAAVLTSALAAPVYADVTIAGDVIQSFKADNVTNASIGSNTYARQDLNTVYDGAKLGGKLTQTIEAKNMTNAAIGSHATACMSVNVIGQRDCSMR